MDRQSSWWILARVTLMATLMTVFLAGCGRSQEGDDTSVVAEPRAASAEELPQSPLRISARFEPATLLSGGASWLTVRLRNQEALDRARDGGEPTSVALPEAWPLALRLTTVSSPDAGQLGWLEDLERQTRELVDPGKTSAALELGVRPVRGSWVLSPDVTKRLEAGRYVLELSLDLRQLELHEALRVAPVEVSFVVLDEGDALARSQRATSVARFERQAGRFEQAASAAREAVALDSGNHQAYQEAAESLIELGDRAAAIAMYEQLLGELPRSSDRALFIKRRMLQLRELGDESSF